MWKFAAVIGVLLLATACGSDGDDSSGDPEAALNAYAEGINAGSVDDVMATFAKDAVLVDHPLHPGELNGTAEIRVAMTETVTFARVDPDPYSVSDVVVDGDTVSWSYLWINDADEEFCGAIEGDTSDELFTEMRWGEDPGTEQCEAAS